MAKVKKDKQEAKAGGAVPRVPPNGQVGAASKRPENERSVLRLAWDRFEAGDVVAARQLANAVLAGKVGPDDLQAATDLSRLMSSAELAVPETIEGVARALVERTRPVPKSYLFAALSLGVFALLVTLAVTRYLS
jgi:hypothetical protein